MSEGFPPKNYHTINRLKDRSVNFQKPFTVDSTKAAT